MSLKLNSSGGGSVTLQEPVTASTLTFTLPAFSGTAATLASVTNNGVLFVNSSGQPTSGSALTFDGTNLKIATTSNASLNFGSVASTFSQIKYNDSDGSLTIGSLAGGNYPTLFQVGGSEQMRLTSTGLGIGTSSPVDKLDVGITAAAPSNSNFLGITVGPTSGSTAVGEGVGIGFRLRNTAGGALGGNSFGAAIYGIQTNTAANTGGLAFYTRPDSSTFSERMRIDSSGNLLVGATSAGAGNSRVYINGDGTNPAFRALANTSTTSVYAGIFRHESTTAGAYIQFVTDTNVETGRIYDSAGTMQYASSSDARLKTNVQPLQNGLSSVLAMNPCTYDMRRGETTTIPSAGLIAQEVFEVYPYAVGVGGDDEKVNPWSVDYGKLTPLLIKAIQEQQAMIAQLQADIASLKGTA